MNRLLDARDRSLLVGFALALLAATLGLLTLAAALGLALRLFLALAGL